MLGSAAPGLMYLSLNSMVPHLQPAMLAHRGAQPQGSQAELLLQVQRPARSLSPAARLGRGALGSLAPATPSCCCCAGGLSSLDWRLGRGGLLRGLEGSPGR